MSDTKKSIPITVNIDPRRLAEALSYLKQRGYTTRSKSGVGARCIMAVANAAVESGDVPECETFNQAFSFLEKNGLGFNRDRDERKKIDLLTDEDIRLEDRDEIKDEQELRDEAREFMNRRRTATDEYSPHIKEREGEAQLTQSQRLDKDSDSDDKMRDALEQVRKRT
jgi:hypothetical protein